MQSAYRFLAIAGLAMLASGCVAIAVVDTAASVAVKGVGLAADAAIGTVKLTGKAVGAAADLVIPDSDKGEAPKK
jgi:hypothetical protein